MASYISVMGREVDKMTWRVGICPALVLSKAHYKHKSVVSFIWELNDLRWDRNPQLILILATTFMGKETGPGGRELAAKTQRDMTQQ